MITYCCEYVNLSKKEVSEALKSVSRHREEIKEVQLFKISLPPPLLSTMDKIPEQIELDMKKLQLFQKHIIFI